MDRFKVTTGLAESFFINEKNFTQQTGKRSPYCKHDISTGKERLYAVCPLCDNPIQIIGLYRNTPEAGRKPYGRHNKGSVPELAEYHEDEYLNCPYSNPGWTTPKRGRRDRDDPVGLKIKQLLKEQFDRVILIISQKTNLYISYKVAQEMLECYIDNEAWTYRNARAGNLPWVLAEADRGRPLFGHRILKDSDLHHALAEKCPEVSFQPLDDNRYVKVASANMGFVSLSYCFQEHKFIHSDDGEHIDEQICFRVTRGQPPHMEEIFKKIIPIDTNEFIRLCKVPPDKGYRNERLLKIANEIIK